MFNSISWQGYWTFLAITLALYYAFVLFLYYRPEVVRFFGKRKQFRSVSNKATVLNTERQASLFKEASSSQPDITEAPEPVPAARSLVDELQAFFEGAKKEPYTKENMLSSLKLIIRKYPGIENTGYRYSVNSLILFLSEEACAIHLSAEEVSSVWM